MSEPSIKTKSEIDYVVYYGSKTNPKHKRSVFKNIKDAQEEIAYRQSLGLVASGVQIKSTTVVTTTVTKI